MPVSKERLQQLLQQGHTKLVEQYLDLDLAERCQADFRTFTKTFWPVICSSRLHWFPYLDALCDHLQHITDIQRLIISIPVRSGKSTITNVLFPAWFWLQHPATKYLCCSYSLQKLSIRDSIACKRLIQSPLYQRLFSSAFRLVEPSTQAKWVNDHMGERYSASPEACIGGESRLFDPVANLYRRVDKIQSPFHVWAWDGERLVIARASKPFAKGRARLYRFHLSNGQSFIATMAHRVCAAGSIDAQQHGPCTSSHNTWQDSGRQTETTCRSFHTHRETGACGGFVWQDLRECVSSHRPSSLVSFPAVLCRDAVRERSSRGIVLGSLSDYPECRHLCGGQLLQEVNSGPMLAPSPADAPAYNACMRGGEWGNTQADTCLYASGHPSSSDCPHHNHVSARITSYEFVREDVFYDLSVPYYENYIHAGITHHNSVTGQGCDIVIADDLNDVNDVWSDVKRQKVLDWWGQTLSSRMNPGGLYCKILMAARCHEEDVVGFVKANSTDWVDLCLPYECDDKRRCVTPLWSDTRQDNEPLHDLFTQGQIAEFKSPNSLGLSGFESQFNQRPRPKEGACFLQKWFGYYEETESCYLLGDTVIDKRDVHYFCTSDFAVSLRDTADFSVLDVWAITPHQNVLLIEEFRDRVELPTLLAKYHAIHERYHPECFYCEDVGTQKGILQLIRTAGLPCRGLKSLVDKMARAQRSIIRAEAGHIWLPKLPFIHEWLHEVTSFPVAKHDDRVDSLSMVGHVIPKYPLRPLRVDQHHDNIEALLQERERQLLS